MRSRLPSRLLISLIPFVALMLLGGAWMIRRIPNSAAMPGDPRPGTLRAAEERGLIEHRGSIARGQLLRPALLAAGIDAGTSDEIMQRLDDAGFDFRTCRPGEHFTAKVDSAGMLRFFSYDIDRVTSWQIARDARGVYRAGLHTTAVRIDIVSVEGTLQESVYRSILAQGESAELVATYADVLGYDVDFVLEPRDGDRFRMLVEKKMLDGECIGYGHMLAATYDGEETGHVAGYYYCDSTAKTAGWYGTDGGNLERAFLRSPLSILRVTSGFGMRTHPISGKRKLHAGTDYGAPTGTPAWTVGSGVVTAAGPSGGYGNLVEVSHPGGIRTRYGHLSKILVRRGQAVRQKQTIGLVGSTGYSTGPHLHFEYIAGGHPVAPRSVKNPPLQRIPKQRMGAFAAFIKAVDARWDRVHKAHPEAVASK